MSQRVLHFACFVCPLPPPPRCLAPPKVVENREGSRWTPACVAFKGGGDPIIGNIARAQRFEVQCLWVACWHDGGYCCTSSLRGVAIPCGYSMLFVFVVPRCPCPPRCMICRGAKSCCTSAFGSVCMRHSSCALVGEFSTTSALTSALKTWPFSGD